VELFLGPGGQPKEMKDPASANATVKQLFGSFGH